MKVKVTLTCGTDVKSLFISCGRGDKTIKWLGLVVSQRFALSAPNGATRRRESDIPHGISQHAQQLPYDMKSKTGESLHPSSQISDILKDGDEIFCTLGSTLPIDQEIGTPTMTKWSSTAFLTMDYYSQHHDDLSTENEHTQEISTVAHQSKAQFMKVILASQMYDYKKVEMKLFSAWEDISLLLPRLTSEISLELRTIFYDYAIILFNIFEHYTADAPNDQMDYQAFQLFIENSEIFPHRDLIKLTRRIYQSTIRDSSTSGSLTFTEFMVSLIYTAQLRYNDTLDVDTSNLLRQSISTSIVSSSSASSHPSVEILSILFQNHLVPLAESLSLDCLIRLEFNSSQLLYQLKEYHHDLFQVFEFYSNKLSRDLALTVTHQHLLEILYQSGLIDSYQETYQNMQMIQLKFINLLSHPLIIGREKNDTESLQSEGKVETARETARGIGRESARDSARGTPRDGRHHMEASTPPKGIL
jgi:hypothetical protein